MMYYGSMQRKLPGYTLLELLVVISLITIAFGFGFARYQDFQRRQQLQAVVRQIQSDLRLAQEYSLAGRKPMEPAGNACETSTLNGYVFDRVNSTSYQIEANCEGGDVTVRGPVTIDNATITISSSNSFLFKVLGKGVDRSATVTVTQTSTGVSSQISISQAGEIK